MTKKFSELRARMSESARLQADDKPRSMLAEMLCALKTADYFAERARRGDLTAALAMLNRNGGQAPDVEDRR